MSRTTTITWKRINMTMTMMMMKMKKHLKTICAFNPCFILSVSQLACILMAIFFDYDSFVASKILFHFFQQQKQWKKKIDSQIVTWMVLLYLGTGQNRKREPTIYYVRWPSWHHYKTSLALSLSLRSSFSYALVILNHFIYAAHKHTHAH